MREWGNIIHRWVSVLEMLRVYVPGFSIIGWFLLHYTAHHGGQTREVTKGGSVVAGTRAYVCILP